MDTAEELLLKSCHPAPFDSEEEAAAERDKCDYSVKITVDMAK